jgi:DNA-binding NarL/FixJ family response regulator
MIQVLIADDQALVRAGFRMILEAESDIDVVGEAVDGAEAVELTRALQPAVVLMDIRMPNLDGLEAPAEQLIAGIRIVAGGEALLAPSITRRVIEQFAQAPPTVVEPPPALDELTPRELEVFKLVARGLSNAEIAEELVVSDTTVKTHVARVLMKLGLRDRVQAVVLAYESGVVARGG